MSHALSYLWLSVDTCADGKCLVQTMSLIDFKVYPGKMFAGDMGDVLAFFSADISVHAEKRC